MNDDMDFYLSRCLKNRAAKSQPPSDGRARLLQAANSPPVRRERQIIRIMTAIRNTFFGRDWAYPDADWFIGPRVHSRAWSLHVETNPRFAFY